MKFRSRGRRKAMPRNVWSSPKRHRWAAKSRLQVAYDFTSSPGESMPGLTRPGMASKSAVATLAPKKPCRTAAALFAAPVPLRRCLAADRTANELGQLGCGAGSGGGHAGATHDRCAGASDLPSSKPPRVDLRKPAGTQEPLLRRHLMDLKHQPASRTPPLSTPCVASAPSCFCWPSRLASQPVTERPITKLSSAAAARNACSGLGSAPCHHRRTTTAWT